MSKLAFLAAAVALAVAGQAGAQSAKVPDAQKTTGEMSPQQKIDEGMAKGAKPGPSTVDAKAAKAEAQAARKANTTNEGECGPEQKADAGACKKPATPKSDVQRAAVKKDAAAAAKSGKTPGGEKP